MIWQRKADRIKVSSKIEFCPVHLPGQNQNCPRRNIYCTGQKSLSEAKKFMFACEKDGY